MMTGWRWVSWLASQDLWSWRPQFEQVELFPGVDMGGPPSYIDYLVSVSGLVEGEEQHA